MAIIEVTVPTIGESVNEVTVSQFLVEDGTYVDIDQSICEFESDKATLELPAPKAGVVTFKVEEGDDLNIGDLVCTIDTDASGESTEEERTKEDSTDTSDDTQANKEDKQTSEAKETYATGHPSPAAAKLMSENDIKADDIAGSGVDGRITKEDVLAYLKNKKEKKAPPKPAPKKQAVDKSTTSAPVSTSDEERSVRTERMSRLRKTIAKRLVFAKNSTAMLTTFNEVDLTEIKAVRSKYKERFREKHGVGLGFMSFFTKACAIALTEFPAVNAYIVEEGIEYHDYVDISIAVSTPKGLVVPVIRNAETLSLQEIEGTVKSLAIKGRDGKLTMDDMTGGTFTISNGGVFGSLQSTPILNPPQSAILGMHKIQDRPMAINGEVKIRPMMYLALSYDHRIIDGKEAVSFLVRVKDLLEEPMKLFLDI